MARAALQQIVLCLAATGWLSGCVTGTATEPAAGKSAAAPAQVPGQPRSGSGREVEAPDVFQATDSALWDGRPSLGGIWVASPEAVDPERVVMFNAATGKSVTGALFRRERDNPGPVLQVSSDAADALGMLAGQPTELRVTALRKVEKAAPAAEGPAPSPVVAGAAVEADAETSTAEAAGADGTDTEAAAIAAAAIAATSTAAGAGADAAVAGTDAAGVSAVDAADAATDPAPAKRKTWKERRAEAKARRDAEKAAAAAALAGDATVPTTGDGAIPTAESAGVSAVETAPLDARSPEVAAAAEAATDAPASEPVKKTRKEIRAEEKAAKEAEAAAEAAAQAPVAETAAAAPAGRPIQIASFSKEENANRAVEALAKIGVTATPQKSEQSGKIVWGVVATGDDALLQSIKGAGFADAYFLK